MPPWQQRRANKKLVGILTNRDHRFARTPDAAETLLQEATDDVERTWCVYSGRAATASRAETPNISPRAEVSEPATAQGDD